MSTQPDGYRRSAVFEWPAAVPWSELGPEFMREWGRPEGRFDPESVEITGQNGSGKTYLLVDLLQQRARLRGSAEILVVTKEQDATFARLGWPVISDVRDLGRYQQVIFWPRTALVGEEREKFYEAKIYDLLARLYRPDANVVIAFDEIGYIEDLSRRMKKLIRQYWRESRSHGITIIAMKQRPIGVVRDQHSESRWKFVFPPADRGDMDRFAELLGAPRDWAPVLDSLDQRAHEFVVRSNTRNIAYISWIDYDVQPIAAQARQEDRTPREYLHGRRRNRT
jgi:nucleoside-triphosphatase THEP1